MASGVARIATLQLVMSTSTNSGPLIVRFPTHAPTHCTSPNPATHSHRAHVFTHSPLLLQPIPSGPPSSPTQSLIPTEVWQARQPLRFSRVSGHLISDGGLHPRLGGQRATSSTLHWSGDAHARKTRRHGNIVASPLERACARARACACVCMCMFMFMCMCMCGNTFSELYFSFLF